MYNIIRFHKKLIEDDTLRVVPNPHLFKKTYDFILDLEILLINFAIQYSLVLMLTQKILP
jgi:hypothetical protein